MINLYAARTAITITVTLCANRLYIYYTHAKGLAQLVIGKPLLSLDVCMCMGRSMHRVVLTNYYLGD